MNRQTGTAKPRSASIAFSSAWRTFSFDRRAVRNRTLPVWMCVSTSSNPAAESASRSSAIGYLRLPTLTARRNAMKVGMDQMIVRRYDERDLSRIGLIHSRSRQAAYAGLVPPNALALVTPEEQVEVWRVRMATLPSPNAPLVVEVDGEVVGFAVGQLTPRPARSSPRSTCCRTTGAREQARHSWTRLSQPSD